MSSSKRAIEAQPNVKREARPCRVSVTLPKDLRRKVDKFAKDERRLLAPALVVLIEKGLQASANG